MPSFKCPGCKEEFASGRSLGTHKRYCKEKITAVTAQLLEERKVNLEKKAQKRQKLEAVEEGLTLGDAGDENNEMRIEEAPCATVSVSVV